MSELFSQWNMDKEALIQKMVNVFLQTEEDMNPSMQEIIDMLVADGCNKHEVIDEIVNRTTNQGQSESACVRIIGEGIPIDFEDINKNLPLLPAKITKKGEKYRFVTAENDFILYEIEEKNEDTISNINALLDSFLPYKEYIYEISQKYYISLRLSLSSDFGQMYCMLPKEIMRKIAELKLNLEISILSFGGVIDISDDGE